MSLKSKIGYGFVPADAASAIETIVSAEAAGIGTAWCVMPVLRRDTLTLLSAAALKTSSIKLGTSIVPAFSRHPVAMATQVLTLEDLAPGRIRLGIGTAHQETMILAFGLQFRRPLSQLREYVQVLNPLLKTGRVAFDGLYYQSDAALPLAPGTPLLISTLREQAFELAGELTDGAITWLCPLSFLEDVGRPAMARGASRAGQEAPPLIAHVLVSPRTDRDAVKAAAKRNLGYYASAVFYQRMFAAAGYPLNEALDIPDALVDALVVSGSETEISDSLIERLNSVPDELLVSLIPSDDLRADEQSLFNILGKL
jgi:alkanesulfonate monooxygenase SsuD/methylene tetrahydromethanopterin reductase-like flavin-dependent oxidoreductase (luciferase family)